MPSDIIVVGYFMFETIGTQTGPNWKLRIALASVIIALGAGFVWLWRMTQMPLRPFEGPLPALSAPQAELAGRLADHVKYLSATIGERNVDPVGSLQSTIDYLRKNLVDAGYAAREQTYNLRGDAVSNVEAELVGTSSTEGIVVVGAHYDTVEGTVGADDNASGVAATLELARLLRTSKLRRTIRFVFFVNEEPPYFQTDEMGSLVYAQKLRRDAVPVSAMISLEMLGFYSDAAGSQKYPPPLSLFYPNRGDFIGFVGNSESRCLVRKATRMFRESASFPSEGLAAPGSWPGVGWSDHWSFWQQGYPAIMVTDTALFRNPYYHSHRDTADRLDFGRMARVVDGVGKVIVSLANE
jgi:Zn-dependent M28 family amino/carboxypeptidase